MSKKLEKMHSAVLRVSEEARTSLHPPRLAAVVDWGESQLSQQLHMKSKLGQME